MKAASAAFFLFDERGLGEEGNPNDLLKLIIKKVVYTDRISVPKATVRQLFFES